MLNWTRLLILWFVMTFFIHSAHCAVQPTRLFVAIVVNGFGNPLGVFLERTCCQFRLVSEQRSRLEVFSEGSKVQRTASKGCSLEQCSLLIQGTAHLFEFSTPVKKVRPATSRLRTWWYSLHSFELELEHLDFEIPANNAWNWPTGKGVLVLFASLNQ